MSLESNAAYQGLDRSFCIRMKSTLTKRGCHFKSSGYRVVMVLCRLRPSAKMPPTNPPPPGQPIPLLGMIAMAIALPPPTVHEVRLEPDMFVTRLSFDLRIVHCEPRYYRPAYPSITAPCLVLLTAADAGQEEFRGIPSVGGGSSVKKMRAPKKHSKVSLCSRWHFFFVSFCPS